MGDPNAALLKELKRFGFLLRDSWKAAQAHADELPPEKRRKSAGYKQQQRLHEQMEEQRRLAATSHSEQM